MPNTAMTPPQSMPARTQERRNLLSLPTRDGEVLRVLEEILRRLIALERRG